MTKAIEFEKKTKALIDGLKSVCANYGLGNDGNEFKIITQVFLYKFLNDKFVHEIKQIDKRIAKAEKWEEALKALDTDDYELLTMQLSESTARLKPEHFISSLFERQNKPRFAELFDNTLLDIAKENSDIFSVVTDGGEVCTWSWPVKSAAEIVNDEVRIEKAGPVGLGSDGIMLMVEQGGVQFRFDTLTGFLSGIRRNGVDVSLSGPELAGKENRLRHLRHYPQGEGYVVESVFEGDGGFSIKWTFTPGHATRLQYQYLYRQPADFMGIVFDFPEEDIAAVTWMGRGPYRVWKNRLRGQQFGVWRKKYNNSVTGESWEYPEFKGYHADLYWARFETGRIPFTIQTSTPGIFLQLLKPDRVAGADNDNTHPPFPDGNVGFLHAISPIGTKFQKAEVMGPSGGKNIMLNNTPFKGELWIDFWH